MMGLKDIEPAAILENENWWDGYEPEETDWLLETVDCTTLDPTEAFVKLYSSIHMQKFAISFAAFALKEGEPIDLVTSEDYQKHAEELFKKFEEKQDEEVCR